MATVDPTQTITRRTPSATWLAGLELPGVPPDTNALRQAVQKYLDSMDATLEVLSEDEMEANVVEQLSLAAYHKTIEMREFFEAWEAAAPQNTDELKQQAKQAFFKSQPVPQAMYLTKAFEAILDADLSKAAFAIELIARHAAKATELHTQSDAKNAFGAVEAGFVEVEAMFSSLANWQRLAEQEPTAERSQALATTIDQLATRGTEILADIQGRLEAIQVFPLQAIMDGSAAESLSGAVAKSMDATGLDTTNLAVQLTQAYRSHRQLTELLASVYHCHYGDITSRPVDLGWQIETLREIAHRGSSALIGIGRTAGVDVESNVHYTDDNDIDEMLAGLARKPDTANAVLSRVKTQLASEGPAGPNGAPEDVADDLRQAAKTLMMMTGFVHDMEEDNDCPPTSQSYSAACHYARRMIEVADLFQAAAS